MKIAYLDCFSGLSGDMFLGALLDAGLPLDDLKAALGSLPLTGYGLEAHREGRNNLYGTRFVVHVEKDRHAHRGLNDIKKILSAGDLSRTTLETSILIFEAIAREEAKIHNRSVDEIHFHEVGAVDSIIDIAGSVFGMERLGIGSLIVSPLPLGSGFIEAQHGRIPVPAPATIALLKDVPVYDSGLKTELVTPTGAALARGLAEAFGPMPPMVVDKVGYGVGTRQLQDRPNLLRIVIGREVGDHEGETIVLLEANLDDTPAEWLGFLMEQLFEAGALDVLFYPVYMKKNRPGTLVQVLAKPRDRERLMGILFRESTTLGVRFQHTQRRVLPRSAVEVDSPWGKIKVKKTIRPDGTALHLPEYEACRRIARDRDIPLKDIYGWVLSLNHRQGG